MAKYNEKGILPSEGDADVGLDPTSTGPNRLFWNDRFVEPKQQHRFTIKMPVYTPMGRNKDTVRMAEAIRSKMANGELRSDEQEAGLSSLKQKLRDQIANPRSRLDGTTVALKAGGAVVDDISTELEMNSLIQNHFKIEEKDAKGFSNPNPSTEVKYKALGITSVVEKAFGALDTTRKFNSIFNPSKFEDDEIGLYLRIPEYIGSSFTPPGFAYTIDTIGKDGNGNPITIEGSGQYDRSAATLSFVTTLRDDLHFSLNLIWALSTVSNVAGLEKSSVRLFSPLLTNSFNEEQKVITIYEHYARSIRGKNASALFPKALEKFDKDMQKLNKSKLDGNFNGVSAVHKLYNPVIQSANFSEFSYGGAELVKITLSLTYGPPYNQSNFYSYQNTDARYGDGKVYAMSEGDYKEGNEFHDHIYGPVGPPQPSTTRYGITNVRPNFVSSIPKDIRTLEQIKRERASQRADSDHQRSQIRDILESNGNGTIFSDQVTQRKNALFSKEISNVLQQREENAATAGISGVVRGRGGFAAGSGPVDQSKNDVIKNNIQTQDATDRSRRARQRLDSQRRASDAARSPSERVMPGNTETIEQLDLLKN